MIEFIPVGKLRKMGQQVERRIFGALTGNANSVEKTIAGAIFRFILDEQCPAIIIRTYQAGEEIVDGLICEEPYELSAVQKICCKLNDELTDNLGTKPVTVFLLDETVLIAVKNDILKGDWMEYSRYVSGKDGFPILKTRKKKDKVIRNEPKEDSRRPC